jgi:hypothetical protein
MNYETKSDEHFMSIERVKEGFVYRSNHKTWQKQVYGFEARGMGDLWYNLFRMIILTDDKSEWAVLAFYHAAQWMKLGKRWPDWFNNEHIAKNRLDWTWCNILWKLGLRPTKKHRWQTRITRDPWIMMYCCAIHLGKLEYLKLRPQWWLYNVTLWEWRKELLGKRNIYRLLDRIKPRKDFVITLHDYMRRYAKLIQTT